MILSNREIQRLSGEAIGLIAPFISKNLRLSSYDLTIGDEYYSGFDGKSHSVETQGLKPGQAFTIPPHGVCFILSEERISLPYDVTAKVSLRMSLVYRGLVLTAQPPFDPGYTGKAIVMVHNLSSQPHSLKRGGRIATIEFFKVGNPDTTGEQKVHRSVTNLMAQLAGPVSSSLSHISEKAEAAHEKISSLHMQILGFAALIVALAGLTGLLSYNAISDRLGDQKTRVDDLNKVVDEQRHAIANMRQQLNETRHLEAQAVLPTIPSNPTK